MYSHVIVIVDGVWIGNWIYSTHKAFSVFTSRCLVAASNGGRFSSSWFPELSPASARSLSLLRTATLN
jgi:hypothetical protein